MAQRNILIVDDSRLSLQLMSALLRQRNPDLSIDTESQPLAALERIGAGDYALVMLDLNMPGLNGEELASRIRADGRQMPLCFVTANVQQAVKQRLETQYGPVFHKPVNEALAEAILAHLDRSDPC